MTTMDRFYYIGMASFICSWIIAITFTPISTGQVAAQDNRLTIADPLPKSRGLSCHLVNIITTRHACAARGKVIEIFLNLSKYSLSEVHSSTGRLLFEFNCLQYTLAALEVFVEPVSLPSGYRVSIVRNTNINHTPTV